MLMNSNYLQRTGGNSVLSSKSSSNWQNKSHFIINSFKEFLLTSHIFFSIPIFTVSGTTQIVSAQVKQHTAGLSQNKRQLILKVNCLHRIQTYGYQREKKVGEGYIKNLGLADINYYV